MNLEAKAAPADHVLTLSRVFQAPREAVFRAFTDPAQVKNWFGPRGFSADVDRYDARPGGTYRMCMISPDGNALWLHGTFLMVEPHDRLSFTWIWEQGDMAGKETLVTIGFRSVGQTTEIALRHDRLPSEASREAHGKGWISTLDCLEDVVKQPGRAS